MSHFTNTKSQGERVIRDGFKGDFRSGFMEEKNLNKWKKRHRMKDMKSMLFLYKVYVLSLSLILTF